MFTGIIEASGTVTAIHPELGNKTFWINSPVSTSLKIDQSVNHNGVCLTIEDIRNGEHRVTAIAETLAKTNLDIWKVGSWVNIERCMQLNGRLDGHLVQGHVDTIAKCTALKETSGSWQYRFGFPQEFNALVIEKGSITLNGISLTVFNVQDNQFEVAIIPYTYQHTNIKDVVIGSTVNIEFDVIGKYVQRFLSLKNQ
jgi:riboflavin synthase